MKCLLFSLTLVLSASFLTTPAEARIGESRSELESRLLGSGAIVYRDLETRAARKRSKPYEQYLNFIPGSVDVRVYFKTADGRNPKTSELEEKGKLVGWDLHVVYIDGKSMIEVYDRTGGMSEYELNQLLVVNSNGSYWTKAKDLPKEEGEEIYSAFGFDMVRADGNVRAKHSGSMLLLVDTKLDETLAQMNESSLQERAPISVKGF